MPLLNEAFASILLFVVGLIFGVGISFQTIRDHERRLSKLEGPLADSGTVLVLKAELDNLKGKLGAIELELSKLRDSTEEHYRTLENLVTQIVKNSERALGK
jgi:hypothetical protein